MFTISLPKTFRVTLESYDGGCKRKTVKAWCAEDAMGMFTFGKWIAVAVVEVKA